ncbi:phosphate acetyltransferase [Arsenophonus endosymbiont of Aleurodicus dispersus]|uniref:phosphate acetyltransferase n=1 Tax=Arsenophonus endosymbiont of Aleurodicus dispersus TaxID=235559 RepID=UPI001559D7D0|nr:phosphate acetyltransferase [Arsenophonus endosymbiont of Aleurodicus dispersus]
MLIPTEISVGLTSVILGVVRSMEQKGVNLTVLNLIAQPCISNKDQTIEVLRSNSMVQVANPIKMSYVEYLLANDKKDILMEEIIAYYHYNKQQAKVILIEGLIPTSKHPFAQSLNYDIAKAMGADIIFVTTLGNNTPEQLKERIKLALAEFGGVQNKNITGVIINKLNAPGYEHGHIYHDLSEIFDESKKATIEKIDIKTLASNSPLPILGCIPWNFDLIATRGIDIANHLNATIINEGKLKTRRIKSVIFCACSVPNIIKMLRHGSLLVTSSDRHDIIVSACLASINGIEIGALLLTGSYPLAKTIHDLCKHAFETGLPVLMVDTNTWQTSLSLHRFSFKVHADDHEQIKKIQNYFALHINQKWINSLTADSEQPKRLSPPAFRYQLTELARKANKRIVLPEGNEPRTVKAAAICAEKGIATCILLGEPDEIKLVAAAQGVELGAGIEIVVPKLVRKNYVERLVELRKNKGMTKIVAREQLEDNVVLGTMMLEKNEVDGLVSGAVHTTANTIRPPLQLIKTAPGSSIVSSIFFMLLPDQVLVYGDCAINPDPTAEQLSEIAIQSANSAKAFGIEPRVAMISYSTGNSSTSSYVDKVREATCLAQVKQPNLVIDGPLQYDAAIMADVAKSKAPNSPVAGQATVFIFPDLNTGNTTYKAVQRSANLLSIGPMLQGMRKPVNDLSRGALVDDIVYTIAITTIQANTNLK